LDTACVNLRRSPLAGLNRAVILVGVLGRRAMLRTGAGRLAALWRTAYEALILGLAALLRIAAVDAVYVRGSFATGEPVYGLSDLDMIAVVKRDGAGTGADRLRLREFLGRFYEAVPDAKPVVELTVLTDYELEQVCTSPTMTWPFDQRAAAPSPRARFFGHDRLGRPFGARPDSGVRLYGPLRNWRLVAGSDLAAALPESPVAHRWLWAWTELQYYWRNAFRNCARPTSPHAPYFCTKMVAEPARLWLWLLDGKLPPPRNFDVLQEAIRVMPEERPVLELALSLRRSLPTRAEAPLAEGLGWLVRLSTRIADRLGEEATRAGMTEVRLLGRADPLLLPPRAGDRHTALLPLEAASTALPLVDWRARVLPDLADDGFVLLAGDPTDPDELAAAALAADRGLYPAFLANELLVLPTASRGVRPLPVAAFRAVQCPVTDPVSFALISGRQTAEFPGLAGWSAREGAERAVLEHRAWLEVDGEREPSRQRQLSMLFSAARAALFAESLQASDPQLPLTVATIVESVAVRDGSAQPVAETALEEYRTSRAGGGEPSPRTVAAFRSVVGSLPSYGFESRPSAGTSSRFP
jgi:predicted nucleotidyltransferase